MKNHSLFTALLLLISQLLYSQWTQQGQDIDGENAGNESGSAVSMNNSGSRVAIGAPGNSDNGASSGHVRVYEFNGADWVQLGTDIDGENAGDFFGISVSMNGSGNRLAAGARYNDGNGNNSGHVRVFEFNGADWIQLGMDIDGEAADDQSGRSVSLSADGNRLAISARFNDGNGNNAGHVRVYEFDGMNWNQLGMDIDGEAAEDASGSSISLNASGSRLASGGQFNDGNGNNSGHVRVYEFDGMNWNQLGSDIDGQFSGDLSGFSVSLDNNGGRVAIGSPYHGVMNDGHVRVFEFDGMNWVQLGSDINGGSINENFGHSVSLSNNGNRLVAGAPLNAIMGGITGQIRAFEFDGASWNQLAMNIDGEAASNLFGWSVSINGSGNMIAGGAPQNNGTTGPGSGHVRVYTDPLLSYTAIPDLNFEQALIDQGIDSEGILNGQVLTSDIAGVTTLLISNLGIADLTGIEDFSALFSLRCDMNQLTSLDMSNNLNLTNLSCINNQLTAINVSNSSNLRRLFCQGNQLTELDVTDLSALQFLNASNNPMLSCIAVDNPADAMAQTGLYTAWVVDDLMVFANSCGMMARGETETPSSIKNTENNVEAPEENLYSVSVYPNPAGDWLHIALPAEGTIAGVIFYNLQGQQVLASKSNKINISSLTEGTYFLTIQLREYQNKLHKKIIILKQ